MADDLGQLDKPETGATLLRGMREVVMMAVPIIISMASMTAMMFVDKMMVSRHAAWRNLGDAPFAAVDQAGILFIVLMAVPHGILALVSTLASQSIGAGRERQGSHYAWQGVWFSLMVGVVACIAWPFAGKLFAVAGHPPGIRHYEHIYFNWRLLGVPAGCACVALSSFMQGAHRPTWSMGCALVANALNILVNYVLIFGVWGMPEMGVQGAAIATSIADWVQAGLLLAVLLGPLNRHYGARRTWRFDGKRLWDLLKVGLPNGGQMLAEYSSWGVFMVVLIARFGPDAMAGNSAAVQFMMLSFVPCVGLGMSATAVVGRYIGKGEYRLAKQRGLAAIVVGLIYMGACGILFVVFRGWLVSRFVESAEAIRLGSQIMIMAGVFQVFNALVIVGTGCLRGAGDTRYPAITQVVLALTVFAPLAAVFTFVPPVRDVIGPIGPWIGGAFYVVLLGPAFVRRFLSGKWKHIDIFGSKGQKDGKGI